MSWFGRKTYQAVLVSNNTITVRKNRPQAIASAVERINGALIANIINFSKTDTRSTVKVDLLKAEYQTLYGGILVDEMNEVTNQVVKRLEGELFAVTKIENCDVIVALEISWALHTDKKDVEKVESVAKVESTAVEAVKTG